DQHGHATAIFANVLLLERRDGPDQLHIRYVSLVDLVPFRGRKHPAVQTSRCEIRAVVSHDAQKGVIGLKNATLKLPDDDPYDIGVDKTSDLPVAFQEIAVELDVLLGRLPPPLRLEPRERHRGPHQDGADDTGCDREPRPAPFEFPGALLP